VAAAAATQPARSRARCERVAAAHQLRRIGKGATEGAPEGHGEFVLFSWRLGPAGAEASIEGSDVVVIADGRIARVIGFLDKIPQPA
jgi:hypothetical protein